MCSSDKTVSQSQHEKSRSFGASFGCWHLHSHCLAGEISDSAPRKEGFYIGNGCLDGGELAGSGKGLLQKLRKPAFFADLGSPVLPQVHRTDAIAEAAPLEGANLEEQVPASDFGGVLSCCLSGMFGTVFRAL